MNKNNNYKRISITIIITYIVIASIKNYKEFIPVFNTLMDIMTPFIMGAILAYILNPVLKFFEVKLNFKRGLALLATYMIWMILILLLILFVGPIIVKNITEIASQIPFYFEQTQKFALKVLSDFNQSNPGILENIIADLNSSVKQWLPQIGDIVITSATQFIDIIVSTFTSIFDGVMSIIISFYLLAEKENIIKFFKKGMYISLKDKKYCFCIELIKTLNSNIGVYVSSKLLDSLVVGFISAIALFMVGSKYSILLGIIMVFANLIPYFGPAIGMVPAVIINLFYNPIVSIYSIVALLIVQQIEVAVIEPKIVGGQLGLNPLLTLLSISIGGTLFGITGMIMATPIMGVVRIYIVKYIEHKYNLLSNECESKQPIF